jgi:two-component system, chemotaxis family, protein-glutamate methylesterase/glutaminase
MHSKSKVDMAETRPGQKSIRVLVVDDSAVTRAVLAGILASDSRLQLLHAADGCANALGFLHENQVDIILLDIEMPKKNGLDALPEILSAAKDASVLVVSSHAAQSGPAALRALELGAADTLEKPGRGGFTGAFAIELVDKIFSLVGDKKPVPVTRLSKSPSLRIDLRKPSLVAIGASTGGIPSIFTILRGLDPAQTAPIVITQHLPANFMEFFVSQIQSLCKRNVSLVSERMRLIDGHIYVAPGDAHLFVRKDRKGLYAEPSIHGCDSRYCPSVDAMLGSAADAVGGNALAIILSGMGNDGAAGAEAFHASGGQILVQDAVSSVVWGMPGAIARKKLAIAELCPEDIVALLNKAKVA